MSAARVGVTPLIVVAMVSFSWSVALAQGGGMHSGGRFRETRANLEAQAKVAESQHHTAEAALLRARLRDGDFQEGDRMVLAFETGAATVGPETLTVRVGNVIEIPHYAQIALAGVLHSELKDRVTKHLLEYFNTPVVTVNPLIRLAVQGSVMRPGSYYASPDAPLSDVVMLAGGQALDADWERAEVRRGGLTFWKASDLQTAVGEGLSVDQMQMRSGDEVFVGRKVDHNYLGWIQLGLSVITIGLALRK